VISGHFVAPGPSAAKDDDTSRDLWAALAGIAPTNMTLSTTPHVPAVTVRQQRTALDTRQAQTPTGFHAMPPAALHRSPTPAPTTKTPFTALLVQKSFVPNEATASYRALHRPPCSLFTTTLMSFPSLSGNSTLHLADPDASRDQWAASCRALHRPP
jgi:hypothetical protein